jgi:hypothetical protein
MKRISAVFALMLVLGLTAGMVRAADPALGKVYGTYMGEKVAQILQNYFNAVAPYAKVKGSSYDNTAPMAAFFVFDAKAQVIRVTVVGSSGDQERSTLETAQSVIYGGGSMVPKQYSAVKLIRDNCGIQLTDNDFEWEFYDAVHDTIHKQGGGLFGKGGLFGNGK